MNNNNFKFSYTLITSLYYPAVLGAIFYFLIDYFPRIMEDNNNIFYILASLAIVISFSVDFLYSYASQSFYSVIHLIFDLCIVTLLFCSYKSLINGIKNSSPIPFFFIGFVLIHIIFVIWDIFFVPRDKSCVKLKTLNSMTILDGLFLLIALFCYFKFKNNYKIGILYLWIFSIPYMIICRNVVKELSQVGGEKKNDKKLPI